jgi:hypothetical protein
MIDREIAVPSYEEIKAARAVLTDDCIRHKAWCCITSKRRQTQAAEKVRSSGANSQPSAAEWDQPHLWPVRPVDK